MNIDTSLLREKFIIKEKNANSNEKALSLSCPSNRMLVNLQAGELPKETYIVRTYNMHSCARMVSQIVQDYEKNGPIMSRSITVDWADLWDKSLNFYDRKYNLDAWVSIYHKGKSIFSAGKYHPFLDVIEKCDVFNKGNYDDAIKLAETSFAKAGTAIDLTYDGNVALVAILSRVSGRCSMVLRGAKGTNTFNYSINPMKKKQKINPPQGLSAAADFLEGVQLTHLIGTNNIKIEFNIIEKYSSEYKQTQDAKKRILELDTLINSMENLYEVRYRPERPNFDILIEISEKFTQDTLLEGENE